jgi:hypothetical protein
MIIVWVLMFFHFCAMISAWPRNYLGLFLLNLAMFEWFTRRRFRAVNMSLLMPCSVAVIVGSVYGW